MVSTIYHHFMLGLFLLAAWTLGAITGATIVMKDNDYRPIYQRAFK